MLVIFQPLGLFTKTFIADEKNTLRNSQKLLQPIQTKLSKYLKTFSNFLFNFLNLHQFSNILKQV